MRNAPRPFETHEQWRQRILDETSRFIEWGLQHPDLVDRIPRHRVGQASFPDRLKNLFWSVVFNDPRYPD